MGMDLWGFKDEADLQRSTADMPDIILKEQIALLGEKTHFVLYGKPTYVRVKTQEIEYKVATIFNVVVPSLDNYEKTILIMYSNPEASYPIAITINSSYIEDCECFIPQYTCDTKEEFIEAVKQILSSTEVIEMIGTLYSKAYMLNG